MYRYNDDIEKEKDNIINFLINKGAKRRRYSQENDDHFWNDHNHLGYKHGDWIN